MSDWLSIIIVILIVGIVLDGIRRARNSRRNEVRLSRNARKADKMFNTELSSSSGTSELPSGGARPKGKSAPPSKASAKTEIETEELDIEPVQVSLELNDPVPMLMDTVEQEVSLSELIGDDFEYAAESDYEIESAPRAHVSKSTSPETNEYTPTSRDMSEPKIGELTDLDDPIENVQAELPEEEKPKAASSFFSHKKNVEAPKEAVEDAEPQLPEQAQEIIIINLMAPRGTAFNGNALSPALTRQKLKFGQMGIFHRHLNNDGDAESVFSLANMVEPGNFDLVNINESLTPGVCFFLSLPTCCEGGPAFEDMVTTARALAEELGGELKDESRSVLTQQMVEHYRQRVMEFELKRKLKKH